MSDNVLIMCFFIGPLLEKINFFVPRLFGFIFFNNHFLINRFKELIDRAISDEFRFIIHH